ncbi:MAG: T9SS type A sorting domain-containing protein [Bacteroidia bacterium]|nr:T9SS type A sorting domain-containing protein [Bacteroidia bacterium]
MKKRLFIYLSGLSVVLALSAFMTQSSNGIQGYAGSPGEGTCSHCHGGGSSGSSGITINSIPAFSFNENAELTFMPDSTYQIDVEVTAAGFSKFGFASQILNSSLVNSGTVQSAGTGVKFLNSGFKRTAVHTTPKNAPANTATFSFQWKAPQSGDATIYAIANAVNGNGSTSGDFVLSPVSLPLVAAVVPNPTDTTTVGTKKISEITISDITAYPNPSREVCRVKYILKSGSTIIIELLDFNGHLLKELYNEKESRGVHVHTFSFSGISEGAYLLKFSSGEKSIFKKLLVMR